ncbi:MAG: pantoate--beta-alanine ligase [Candidatus Omnitrophica bacterium]|nr:pantoate--beta-alanine ligase [Candidatus Omnitrophota bacterium]
MIVVKTTQKLRQILSKNKKTVGFIPTMGALHQGHLSLVRRSRRECGFVVVSIFVNPTQFGPGEDYSKYPKDFAKDKKLLKSEKVDVIFCPSAKEIYPDNFSTYIYPKGLSAVLCGHSRPDHFGGVCTIVAKLFNIVSADVAYFGQKDYQQACIIKKMVRDLNFDLKIKVLPIVREVDGLAMSSRNQYLNKKERADAAVLYSSLKQAKILVKGGIRDPKKIIAEMKRIIVSKKNAKIDYVKIVDVINLQEIKKVEAKVLVAIAVYIGKTRLIDNVII